MKSPRFNVKPWPPIKTCPFTTHLSTADPGTAGFLRGERISPERHIGRRWAGRDADTGDRRSHGPRSSRSRLFHEFHFNESTDPGSVVFHALGAWRITPGLHDIPGSHRRGLLEKPVLAGEMDGIMAFLSEEQKYGFKSVAAELTAGEAFFIHPLMVQGSFKNDSMRPRRGLVINVFKDGTVSMTDETLFNGVPSIPKGSNMEGRFFPLLFDPEKAGCQ